MTPRAVKPVSPEMRAALCVDQLAGDPHAGLVRRVNELYAAARAGSHSQDHGQARERARAEGRPG